MKVPLAEMLRPRKLDEVAGHEKLLGENGWIRRLMKSDKPQSLLLWGPPGCGKTTIAKIYSQAFQLPFFQLSAVFHGIADLKKIIALIQDNPLLYAQAIVFVDEIHRFNKAQQDGFLPYVESGTIILIGATTENPSFSLNNALLSRLRVVPLSSLDKEALSTILTRYEITHPPLPLTGPARSLILDLAQGDARHLLNMIENLQSVETDSPLTEKQVLEWVYKKAALYDKHDDHHFNLISALHKSVRGSDPDASLYWLARMLKGGEDPQFLARRMIRMAVEDIGLADPQALEMALNAWNTYDHLGAPEGELALAEAIVYLALAPKSNAIYTAFKEAQDLAESTAHLPPPKIILNAPTKLMKNIGYGKGYQYDHDEPDAFSGQSYFPEELPRKQMYNPVERGFEREMKKRIDYFEKLRKKISDKD